MPHVLHDPGAVSGGSRASDGFRTKAEAGFGDLSLGKDRSGRPHWVRIGQSRLTGED